MYRITCIVILLVLRTISQVGERYPFGGYRESSNTPQQAAGYLTIWKSGMEIVMANIRKWICLTGREKRGFHGALMFLLLAALLMGCAGGGKGTVSVEEAKDTVIMTLGDYDVTLAEFHLYLIQYLYMQQKDSGSMTEEEYNSVIETVLSEMRLELVQYLVAQETEDLVVSQEDLDSVAGSTDNYLKLLGEDFLLEYGIDRTCVEQLFTEQVYINALTQKAKEDLAQSYYDQYLEEYKDKTFHSLYYALFPSIEYDAEGKPVTDSNGEYISLTEDVMKEQYEKAKELQARAVAGESLEDLIEEYGITASSGAEHDYAGAYGEELNQVIEGMKAGELSEVIETEAGYMVMRMDNPDDVDYKEYAIHYAAEQTAGEQFPQMQQYWLNTSGYANAGADKERLAKLDLKVLCEKMQKNGLY